MTLFHGSPTGNLKELVPTVSEHGKPYVYLSTNPVVALFYAAKPVEKPYSWYPYGFDGETPVYTEYYENALYDVYGGRSGYLYECESNVVQNPTKINCALTAENPVKVTRCTEISDLYEHFLLLEKQGKLKIKRFFELSEGDISFIENYLSDLILKNDLRFAIDGSMSCFIKRNFPHLW